MLKLTHGTTCLSAIALVLAATASGLGCAASPSSGNNGGGGGDQSTGGNPVPSGSGGTVGGNGSGGVPSNPNGFDDGKLFPDAGPPTSPPMDASTGGDTTGAETGGAIGMAVKMFPDLNITLSFTQKGADVTMVAKHKGCGAFTIVIHNGFSCDNVMTQGGVWDGKRGDGITGNTVCDAQQNGTLTYTRPGADPALAWTVGDHIAKTDITYHPIFVDGHCVTFF